MPTRLAIAIIVIAELFGTSLWFSANAVADALQREWGTSVADLGHLTSAVQLGFITGTLVIALTGIADRFSASRIFAATALLGAVANVALAWALKTFVCRAFAPRRSGTSGIWDRRLVGLRR